MEDSPKIKIELTTVDKIFEVLCWLSIIAIWVLTIANYDKLPDTIPTHYNGLGQADGFGGKATILTLPIVATVLFIGITILNKSLSVFKYPINITKDKALRLYTNVTKMARHFKLVIVIIFGLIEFKTIQYGARQSDGLGMWFLPLNLGLVLITLIYYFVVRFKAK